MTPTTPSPISDQAADLLEKAALVCENMACAPQFEPEIQDRMLRAAAKSIRALSTAPTTGSAPVATLHDDGYYTFHGEKPHGFNYQGWRMDVYAAPASPAASVPIDEQTLKNIRVAVTNFWGEGSPEVQAVIALLIGGEPK